MIDQLMEPSGLTNLGVIASMCAGAVLGVVSMWFLLDDD